jgi:hypothetical protein
VPDFHWQQEDVIRRGLRRGAGGQTDGLKEGIGIRQVDDTLDLDLDRWQPDALNCDDAADCDVQILSMWKKSFANWLKSGSEPRPL